MIIINNYVSRAGLILAISLLLALQLDAQYLLRGSISNSESEVLKGVNIKMLNSDKGTYSDNNGNFVLQIIKLPIQLTVSHVGYKTQIITVNNTKSKLNIVLKKLSIELDEVPINADRIINLVEKKKLYVIDYSFEEDSILMLCYNGRHRNKAKLILMDKDGNNLISKPMTVIDKLEKDFMNVNHLLTDKTARKIILQDSSISFGEEYSAKEFKNVQQTLIGVDYPLYYVRQNMLNNQVVRIMQYNDKTKELKLLKEILDEAGLERLGDKSRLQSYAEYTEADARFEEMCFYAPKFVPLVKISNAFYLFNFTDDKIEVMDLQGNDIRTISMNFHKKSGWEDKLLVDSEKENIYAVYSKRGIYSICKLNLETGKTSEPIKIPAFAHIENMQVHKGKLYFLYKGNIDDKYKELYSMSL